MSRARASKAGRSYGRGRGREWLVAAILAAGAALATIFNNPDPPQPLLSTAAWLAWAKAEPGAAVWAAGLLVLAVTGLVLWVEEKGSRSMAGPRRPSDGPPLRVPFTEAAQAPRPRTPAPSPRPPTPQELRARATSLAQAGAAAHKARDFETARRAWAEAVAIERTLGGRPDGGDAARLATVLAGLGAADRARQDVEGATRAYVEGLSQWRKVESAHPGAAGPRRGVLDALMALGDLAEARRDLRAALSYYERAAPLAESLAGDGAGAKAIIDRTHCRRRVSELRSWLQAA